MYIRNQTYHRKNFFCRLLDQQIFGRPEKHRFSVTMSCATSLKNLVLHEKLGDWGMGIEGEHPSLGPLGLLKTVETMEGIRGS